MDSIIRKRLAEQLSHRPCTLLGVGPMSLNCVDAAIGLANRHDVDLMLVASRRQIDTDRLGGGYVNGWNASRFAEYVRQRDVGGHILLSRDHGGPWQNTEEIKRGYDATSAMDSARASYEEDIAAGYCVIHIDPSVGPDGGAPSFEDVLERLFTLYEFCWKTARRMGRDIVFEIGTEEQDAVSQALDSLCALITQVTKFCRGNNLPLPFFVVAQTGTKVMETVNVGSMNSPYRIAEEVPSTVHLPGVLAILNHFGLHLKQHNTDYVSDEVVGWHSWLGIHAANVAPEFGVVESRALLHVLESQRLNVLRDRFLEIAYETKKWEKWMLPSTTATDRQKAVIAGHYTFSTPAFLELKAQVQSRLNGSGVVLDDVLRSWVEASIARYLFGFRLVNQA
ncbi:hypothetical protein M2321_003516 [Rhodoblastus acidophilus]|uniref:class II D-tagatose-bisphosphate aldolase non-catalytic subunit n=1 Tax=Rhodoblastus acidophilus TaxID=1074 RepID=UPI0012D7CD22|nr:class II D-tagatose-bisphosphate aldolase, non-catalytic subunit [Rhodoblastus acidophilus]MCW2275917.1 hypothetical protein [Rhodoblastus acidophilus]